MVQSDEEKKAYKDAWYQKNKERIKEERKVYRQKPENKLRKKIYDQRQEVKDKSKVYRDKPENKARAKIYNKAYGQRPEVIARRNELRNRPEQKAKIKASREKCNLTPKRKICLKEYRFNPKNKRRKNKRRKQRRRDDVSYRFIDNLRSNLYLAFKYYSKTGKKKPSKKYGIDYKKIIEHLKPFPRNIENYHIDHIIPISWFDHNNPEEIKWCWSPENFQWLRKELNIWKYNRFILPLTLEEQDILMKEMFPNKVKNN